MATDKPKFRAGYEKWLATERGIMPLNVLGTYYDAVTHEAKRILADTPFWRGAMSKLGDYDASYQLARYGYPLIAEWKPEILIKPFGSFLEKTYRKNVALNARWPDAPEGGWWLPPDWLSLVNDSLRTRLVVKYLDGVPFLAEQLNALVAVKADLSTEFVSQTDGYYAAHLYYRYSAVIPKINWENETRDLLFEIQITTQLKDVITKLLHSFYETRRVDSAGKPSDWGWNYKSDEFVASYLGHILHYVDGMIIDVRERTRKGADGTKT